MKTVSYRSLKRQEATRRMTSVRKATRSVLAARSQQRRASLTGSGAKWKIVNLRQVARAMAAWA